MWLLSSNVDGSYSLTNFIGDEIPSYAIHSHTWATDNEEPTFHDLKNGLGFDKNGFRKVRFCSEQAEKDGLRYFWVDSCCIDKSNNTELQTAINSIRVHGKTLTVLGTSLETGLSAESMVYSRLDLQELLAPRSVEFFSRDGKRLGSKNSLEHQIHDITGIPVKALQGHLASFSFDERRRWAENRKTTIEEDQVYCLLGIFNVFLPLIYGEGKQHAFRRLQVQIDTRPIDKQGDRSHERELQWDQLLEPLSFDEMDDRHRTIQPAHSTTCRWLLDNSKFRDWLDWKNAAEHHGFFWLKGKPGAGKSTLTKFALSETKKSTQDAIHIFFFFNRRGTDLEKGILGIYRSLLSQLLKNISRPEEVFTRLDPPIRYNRIPRWTAHLLKDALGHAIKAVGQTPLFLFVDALDECETDELNSETQDMIAFFQTLTESCFNSTTRLNIFLSSRYYPTITIEKCLELKLEAENDYTRDIEVYIRSKLKTFGTNIWADTIRASILEKAQNVFLWVVLVIPILKREYDEGDKSAVKKKLNDIPGDLEELFKGILTRDEQRMERMRICIQWILFAHEPLTPEELYHAVLSGIRNQQDWELDDEEEEWEEGQEEDQHDSPKRRSSENDELGKRKPSTSHKDKNSLIRRFIVASSKGLAELTGSEKPKVQLIHESVREYLLYKGGLQVVDIESGTCHALSHNRLKTYCENYLNRKQLEEILYRKLPKASSPKGKGLRASVSRKYPFLAYSVRNIFHHAELAAENGVPQADFLDTFRLRDWIHFNNLLERHQIRRYTSEANLTYIFAERDCSNLIRSIPAKDMKLDEWMPNERYKSPIYAALAKKNLDVLKIMLPIPDSNVDEQPKTCVVHNWVEEYRQQYQTIGKVLPIYFFSEICSPSILLFCIQTGRFRADVCHNDVDPRSLMCSCARNGHEGIVKLLLDLDKIDVDSKDKNDRTPLSWAAEKGYEGIVKLLLDIERIDVNSKDKDNQTPLSWAAQKGHEGIFKLLLDIDKINVDPKDKDNRTPLSWAAQNGHKDIVKLLLDTDKVDVDSKAQGLGRTPLSWAAGNGHESIVKLLLDTGKVDINSASSIYRTPLSWAAGSGHEGIVKLLLDTDKVDVNSKTKFSGTPLSWAAENGHESIVKLLLNTGKVDVDSKTDLGGTPLSLAAENGHESIVKLLLDTGKVDIDSESYSYHMSVIWAAQNVGRYF